MAMETHNHSHTFTLSVLMIFTIVLLLSSSHASAGSIVKNLPGFHGDLPFTMETGYVGIGAKDEVQLFYYFVESERDPVKDPLLLYLTGGPGNTALYPFLFQMGSLRINFVNSTYEKLALELDPNAWTKTANMLWIDIPAGAGFSYATTYEGSISSDSMVVHHSYEFLVKWLEEHPKFLHNPLYVAGISYMGLVVPAITLEVYAGNERGGQPQLNIKGYMIMSPLTDKFVDFNSKLEFAHRVALISEDIYESAINSCNGNYIYTDTGNSECTSSLQRMDECTRKINDVNILEAYCDEDNKSPNCNVITELYMDNYGNNNGVQKALHVREGTVEKFVKNNETMHYQFNKTDQDCYSYDIDSSIIYHKALITRECQALILSGDHDFTFPYVGTEQWIKSLGLPIEIPWNPWFVNNQVAGYRTKYSTNGYSLTYATVKGGSHSIPLNKPHEVQFILDEWLTSHSSLSGS